MRVQPQKNSEQWPYNYVLYMNDMESKPSVNGFLTVPQIYMRNSKMYFATNHKIIPHVLGYDYSYGTVTLVFDSDYESRKPL